jgi:hypothetical protein
MIVLIVDIHTNPKDYLRVAVRFKYDQYAVVYHLKSKFTLEFE